MYTLDKALLHGNKLTTKTKDNEVGVIYKALDSGLIITFPYRKWQIPRLIYSSKLHIVLDELKYKKSRAVTSARSVVHY